MRRDVTVTRRYAAAADVVWDALVRPAADGAVAGVLALPGRDVTVRRTAPGSGAAGSVSWDGVRYRLSAHLAADGEGTTLVLSARRLQEPVDLRDVVRFARARWHLRRDLRRVVDTLLPSPVGSGRATV